MISISQTLSRYIAKNYMFNLIMLLAALLAIIYLFDTIELIRRASKRDDIPFSLVLQMGLLKLPEVSQILLPFAILFSAMFTFWQLTRRYELVVMRASGFSVWQFLSPVLAIAFLVGLFQIMLINPLGALLVGRYEQLENFYLKRNQSQVAIFEEGLWLRQNLEDTNQSVILHADNIDYTSWSLKGVTALIFNENDMLTRRIDTNEAALTSEGWVLKDSVIHNHDSPESTQQDRYIIPTNLTIRDIEDSFASPETMSFWQLPGHIRTLEQTGFDATRLKVHYQNLLSQPLFFIAMVLLAASVSMRPPRLRGTFSLIAAGIGFGFFIFFMSSFLQALGVSHQIPVIMAAWAPALVTFLIGMTLLLNLEDG